MLQEGSTRRCYKQDGNGRVLVGGQLSNLVRQIIRRDQKSSQPIAP